jgi:pyruvate,orthophosphate dikinase
MRISPIHGAPFLSKGLFGAKGNGLMEMARLGIPVPAGFILSKEAFTEGSSALDRDSFQALVRHAMLQLEIETKLGFGQQDFPLIVSVRSGAEVSMPGMMDTFLNIGLTPKTYKGLARRLGESEDALGMTDMMTQLSKTCPWTNDSEDVFEHLWHALDLVKQSWNSARAHAYRTAHSISHQGGTAVVVQAMVFGNLSQHSGTGIVFTRHPLHGTPVLFGEFLPSAQGEALVSGARTPLPLSDVCDRLPLVHSQLKTIAKTLEQHYGDMQEIEFTIQHSTLWILQTRLGKRSAEAGFHIACDLVHEGLATPQSIVRTMEADVFTQCMHPQLVSQVGLEEIGQGLAASPGAASGLLTFDPSSLKDKTNYILLRPETAPEDIPAMMASQGVITLRGGMTSHAAVIMRGMGKPCILSLEAHQWKEDHVCSKHHLLYPGEMITLDGTTGRVFRGQGRVQNATFSSEGLKVLDWADGFRRMKVYANAETPSEITMAQSLGAEGIGLCRTEHMMLSPQSLPVMQEFILASTKEERAKSLEALLPLHQNDLYALLKSAKGQPVTVRLLDPPLHEFLPASQKSALSEVNPMLGHRGCRLGIHFPALYGMQLHALFSSATRLMEEGTRLDLSILIPFIMDPKEFQILKQQIQALKPPSLTCSIGAMIEMPRAALLAGDIAQHADFLSFGTNDLTQMTWGLSRDDYGSFFSDYKALGLQDPFEHIDPIGVGALMTLACERARARSPHIKISVCGEHAGDPKSISFFEDLRIDTISCSPMRIPSARFAAAQAYLEKSPHVLHTASSPFFNVVSS